MDITIIPLSLATDELIKKLNENQEDAFSLVSGETLSMFFHLKAVMNVLNSNGILENINLNDYQKEIIQEAEKIYKSFADSFEKQMFDVETSKEM